MALTKIGTTGITDDSITLAKMASGTDGNLITYDTNTNPAYVATGTATHVLTSNGPTLAPTFQAGGGAVTREGGDTTEASTQGTSPQDMYSITGLTIAAITPFDVIGNARKTADHSSDASVGFRLNDIIVDAPVAGGGSWVSSAGAQDGLYEIRYGSRIANYLNGCRACFMARTTSSAVVANSAFPAVDSLETAVTPNAVITDIDTLGMVTNAANVLGLDMEHVYSWATS